MSERATDRPASDHPQPPATSYALLAQEVKKRYLDFYRETYSAKNPSLDRKTKEFVAVAASMAFHCDNCLDGHLKKAFREGATRKEISEVIEVVMGVAAAAMVDRTDLAGIRLGLGYGDGSAPEKYAPTTS